MDRVSQSVVASYAATLAGEGAAGLPGLGGDAARQAVEECFAQRLQVLVQRVYVVEFHRFRHALGLPADPTSDVAVRRYLEGFGADVVDGWRERYPVLDELLTGVARGAARHVGDVCRSFAADRTDLVAAGLLAPDAVLTGVEHLGSDPHNGGRTVAALTFADGSRLIHKPRSLGPEVLTTEVLRILSPQAGTDLTRCAPESLDRGPHGWQREVRATPVAHEGDLRGYYRVFGTLAAVVSALGAVDMHHENVVAVGDHPVLVDLETVMHAGPALAGGDLAAALVARVKLSLAGTLLLPQRIPTGPYSVLMSGIGVPYEQTSERTGFVVTDRDTDAVDLARRTFSYTHSDNLVRRPDGSPADLLDHEADFVEGLRAGHRALTAELGPVLAALDARPVVLRRILRSTAVYGQVLGAATHPDNLGSRERFERVVGMLRAPAGLDRPGVRDFVLATERAALGRGDIPYFTTRSDDLRLLADGRSSLPFSDLSARDRAKVGLLDVAGRGRAFEEHVVEEGFSELRVVRARHGVPLARRGAGLFQGFFADDGVDADAVLQRLQDLAVVAEEVDGPATGWVTGAHGPHLATYDPGTCVSLHDAAGVVLPAERSAATGGAPEREHLQRVRRGIRSLRRRYRESLEGTNLSVASGPVSVDLVLDPGAARHPDAETALLGALTGAEPAYAGDLMRGLPGLALLLASCPGTPQDLLDRALHAVEPAPDAAPWDLAHGRLGTTWARYRLLRRLERTAAAAEVATAFADDLARPVGALPHGWCHGHAGALVVAAEMATDPVAGPAVRRHLPAWVDRATTLPPLGDAVDLSVCHGAAGVVQALVLTARATGDDGVLETARDYWARVAKHARDEGFCTGDRAKRGVLGYFLGWSGIADTTLVLRSASAGRPVWVPTAFARRRPQEVAA